MLRLFADDYSSTNQLGWQQGKRGRGSRHWQSDYLGQLRFDSLVAPTLVIPDSHLFDGPFFLRTSPAELSEALGRTDPDGAGKLPFEVRGRASTLEASLLELLWRDDRDTLNPFPFKALVGDDADRVRPLLAAKLGEMSKADLDEFVAAHQDSVVDAVLALLREALHRVDPGLNAEELLGELEIGWNAWLEQADRVHVAVSPTYRKFDVAGALKREPLKPGTLRTDDGRRALAEVQTAVDRGSSTHRADITELLLPYESPDALPSKESDRDQVLRDLEIVSVWYSRGRYRAICARHGCACVQRDRPWLPPLGVAELLLREILGQNESSVPRVEMPEKVLTRLGRLRADEFRALHDTCDQELDSWWLDGNPDGLRAVAERLAQISAEPSNGLGVAQALPVVGGAFGGYGVARATRDPALSGPAALFIGEMVRSALKLLPGQPEHQRMRVQDALMDRAQGE